MRAIGNALALLLAAFFAFVGYHKAFTPLAELARHGAWTIWLPEPLGRAVGWSELACAVALAVPVLMPRWRAVQRVAALILIVNQLAAAAFHLAHGEAAALPQNAVLIAVAAAVAIAAAQPQRSKPEENV